MHKPHHHIHHHHLADERAEMREEEATRIHHAWIPAAAGKAADKPVDAALNGMADFLHLKHTPFAGTASAAVRNTNLALDGLADPEQEHPFDGTYWHFVDLATHPAEDVLEKLVIPVIQRAAPVVPLVERAIPVIAEVARFMPVIGMAGEAIHVSKPAMRAAEDWWEGRLSTHDAIRLGKIYTVYVVTGAFGFGSVAAKEGISDVVRQTGWMDERYFPHTLGMELQHAGWSDALEDHVIFPLHDALDDSGISGQVATLWKNSGAQAVAHMLHAEAVKETPEIQKLGRQLMQHFHAWHDHCPICNALEDAGILTTDLGGIHERATASVDSPRARFEKMRAQAEKIGQNLLHSVHFDAFSTTPSTPKQPPRALPQH